MAKELIYTSVPEGLAPRSSGYCTVARTAGVNRRLQQFLESLSSYTLDRNSSQLPRLLHVPFRDGSTRLQIVSRVAPCGTDYSRREIFIAHHLALESRELPAAGPAWLANGTGLFLPKWKETPQEYTTPKRIAQGDQTAAIAKSWQRTVNDAGWAGQLAANIQEGKVTWLVITPSTPVVQLLNEAIVLLPASDRWKVSFCTFFQKGTIPSNVQCLCRAVLAGSAEAKVAHTRRGDKLIDLTTSLGVASTDSYGFVEIARTGHVSKPTIRPAKEKLTTKRKRSQPASHKEEPSEEEGDWYELALQETKTENKPEKRSKNRVTVPVPPRSRASSIPHTTTTSEDNSSGFMLGIITGSILLIAILTGGAFYYLGDTANSSSHGINEVAEGANETAPLSSRLQEQIDKYIETIEKGIQPADQLVLDYNALIEKDRTNKTLLALKTKLTEEIQKVPANIQFSLDQIKQYAPEQYPAINSKATASVTSAQKTIQKISSTLLVINTSQRLKQAGQLVANIDSQEENSKPNFQKIQQLLNQIQPKALTDAEKKTFEQLKIHVQNSDGFAEPPQVRLYNIKDSETTVVLDDNVPNGFTPEEIFTKLHFPESVAISQKKVDKKSQIKNPHLLCYITHQKLKGELLLRPHAQKKNHKELVLQWKGKQPGKEMLAFVVVELKAPLFRRFYRIHNSSWEQSLIFSSKIPIKNASLQIPSGKKHAVTYILNKRVPSKRSFQFQLEAKGKVSHLVDLNKLSLPNDCYREWEKWNPELVDQDGTPIPRPNPPPFSDKSRYRKKLKQFNKSAVSQYEKDLEKLKKKLIQSLTLLNLSEEKGLVIQNNTSVYVPFQEVFKKTKQTLLSKRKEAMKRLNSELPDSYTTFRREHKTKLSRPFKLPVIDLSKTKTDPALLKILANDLANYKNAEYGKDYNEIVATTNAWLIKSTRLFDLIVSPDSSDLPDASEEDPFPTDAETKRAKIVKAHLDYVMKVRIAYWHLSNLNEYLSITKKLEDNTNKAIAEFVVEVPSLPVSTREIHLKYSPK